MLRGSLSILSASSFPSTSNAETSSIATPSVKFGFLKTSGRNSKNAHSLYCASALSKSLSKIGASSVGDDDTAQNLGYNRMADFIRFRRGNGDRNGELQTAVVSYRKKFPWYLLQPFLQVDLVSTVHIADKEYFETLQKELEQYDCVLYEMVASKESLEKMRNSASEKKLKNSRSKDFNIVGCIQRLIARSIQLDFQLDCLDYEAENWFHADLDFETFVDLQLERGESFFTFARDMTLQYAKDMVKPAVPVDLGPWRSKLLLASRVLPMPLVGLLIIEGVCAQGESQPEKYPELQALSRLDFGAAMKVFLAKRLTSQLMQTTSSIEEKSVIIGERNKVATEALRRAINGGNKRIAILYGGGHMPDLGRRLYEEFDLVPSKAQWVTAWSIRNRELKTWSLPFLKELAELSGWPLDRYQTLGLLVLSSVLALDLLFWELFFGSAVNWVTSLQISLLTEISRIM
ncbi:hypothetical protein H6P81_000314 [Aristolochia fimbriata]|uniref:Uncharacterized protein n=1 Tax=Aristolochia fimbriata TaxID=158543 RepID=A0AAV7F7J9_ARIFI|nr:hypothetical protein H6P81_000314 [Aristolochia fimbriata]